MSITQETVRVRTEAGLTQAEFGALLAISPSEVSMVERRQRRLPTDVLQSIAARFGDRRLAMAAAKEMCGGIGPTPLGPRCNLHAIPSGVKTREEIREADRSQDWLTQRLINVRGPGDLTAADREEIIPHLIELVELETALANSIDSHCRLTGIDPRELYRRHDAELAAKGYVVPDKTKDRPTKAGR